MLNVGVTGGIGSGKTTICKIFESLLSIPVYYADDRAKQLMEWGSVITKPLVHSFGLGVYKDKQLDRKYLTDIVFADTQKLQLLNEIVHPEVIKDYERWLTQQQTPYTIIETAILFESEMDKKIDKTITVYASRELRIERVMKRDNVSREEVEVRMKQQWDEKQKMIFIRLPNCTIDTNTDFTTHYPLETQVKSAHQQLLELAKP